MIDRKQAAAAFRAYTSRFGYGNTMIRLKAEHTLRVAGICARIAASLGMDEDSADLAWFLGLLHDFGRFEQAAGYGTFVDSVSVDHAELGADLLFRDGLISGFPAQGLAADRLKLLETAVRLHNKLSLPEDLVGETRRFCDLIRDADKADIFRVLAGLSPEEPAGGGGGLPRGTDGACGAVMECVLQHRCVPRDIRETRFDVHVSHCCLAFELVFPESRRIVREQGFLHRMLDGSGADGEPPRSGREREQLRIVRNEIESAWGEPLNE